MRTLQLLGTIIALSVGATSCSTPVAETGRPGTSATSKENPTLGPFKPGAVIPDEKPLKVENFRDLREIALSLPIWEGGWKESEAWVRRYSTDGRRVDEWTNPADGAQHAVTIRRLNDSPEGRVRVEVHHPTLKIFTPDGGWYDPWAAVLERRQQGWFVESVKKDDKSFRRRARPRAAVD